MARLFCLMLIYLFQIILKLYFIYQLREFEEVNVSDSAELPNLKGH